MTRAPARENKRRLPLTRTGGVCFRGDVRSQRSYRRNEEVDSLGAIPNPSGDTTAWRVFFFSRSLANASQSVVGIPATGRSVSVSRVAQTTKSGLHMRRAPGSRLTMRLKARRVSRKMRGPIPRNTPSHHPRVGTTDAKPLNRTTEGWRAANACAGASPVLETSAEYLSRASAPSPVHQFTC